MTKFGNERESTIESPYEDEESLPVSFEEWEQRARAILADGPYGYIAGGAGAGTTMRQNEAAFDRWNIIPRMFRDTSERDTSVTLFKQTFPTPIGLAPIGVQSIVHKDAEIASAKAAATIGVPYITSTVASRSLEQIAEAMGDAPRWFQLYWGNDRVITASMVQRAEKAGYSALVITIDTPMTGWREKGLTNVYSPFARGDGMANYFADPAFCANLEKPPIEDVEAAMQLFRTVFSNPSLTWKDLAFIREQTKLPILLKGILDARDAELAIEYGVDGIIVSNHGGRQVDGSIAAIDALANISTVTQGRIPLLMDSGIRRGSDILKALALGASAVLLGRPYIYGLAVAGEVGVRRVIENLRADFEVTMALSGIKSPSDIDRSLVTYK